MNDVIATSLPDALERAAAEHPDVPFLTDTPWVHAAEEIRTQGQLARHVAELADRLWSAGVRFGDQVVVCKRNNTDILAVAVAAQRLGAVPVLLSEKLLPEELNASFEKLNRPYAVFDDHTAARFGDLAERLGKLTTALLSLGETEVTWLTHATATETHERHRNALDEIAVINHTSGTTGYPKLAPHTHASLYAHAAAIIALSRSVSTQPGKSLRCLSFVHARACSALLILLELGMPLMAVTDPEPEHVKQILLDYRPDTIETHPNIYLRWEGLAADPSRPLGSVRRYIGTFDAIHPRTVRALIAGSDQPDVVYLQGYGQTECGPITVGIASRANLDTLESRVVGAPLGGFTEVRVVDDEGTELPAGTAGNLQVKTHGLQLGYVGGEQLAPGSWWNLGDVGRLREDGLLELHDRAFDKAEGRVSLLELEDRLLGALPELAEVVFVKPEDGLVAVVCPRDGETLDSARWDELAAELGIAEVPVVQRRWEEIPFTGSWKVRRNLLARALQAAE